jgi:hypothetical protein
MSIDNEPEPLTNGPNGTEGRDQQGRFVPGCAPGPGNPYAGSVAACRKALIDAIKPDDIAAVVAKLLEAAKSGKPWAVREFLDRCLGKAAVIVNWLAEEEAQASARSGPLPGEDDLLAAMERDLARIRTRPGQRFIPDGRPSQDQPQPG